MKMKKFVVAAVFTAMTMGASAQSLMVSSAFQDMRKNYLSKAKDEIDKACQHPDTKDDAKTWCYKALIYARIGGDAAEKKSKYKNLAPDWAEQAYTAALECKRLDTKQEFAQQVNEVFSFVGNDYWTRSSEAYQAKNYAEAQRLSEQAVEMFNNAGQSQYASEVLYIAGISAYAQQDTVNVKKHFNSLIRKRTDKEFVYRTLFNMYKDEQDFAQAMKVATTFKRNCKTNPDACLMSAEGYLIQKNIEKGKEELDNALNMAKDNAELYPVVLVKAGTMLDESAGEYEAAEAKFQESLSILPNQFGANYGLGKMFYNRAVDKNNAANQLDPFDEASVGLYEKLNDEAKGFFRQAITYLEKSVAYIDGLTDENAKASQRPNLINSLRALQNAYSRVDMLNETNAIKARVDQLMGN